ncbi:formate dehydrogenase accessory protein FdhE [Desulfurivibrio sp. D14AmB]|uniref:formate dehydrogenase accessory protein FdhE n=1 Tax=Desulfurivibrio sp. D14AmB TaxID=3374370 RepID=UPI00376EDE6B
MPANNVIPETPPALLSYYQQLDELVSRRLQDLQALPFPGNPAAGEAILRLRPASPSLEEQGFVPHEPEDLAANFLIISQVLAANAPTDPLALALKAALARGEFAPEFWRESMADLEERLLQWAETHQLDGDALVQLAHWAATPRRRWAVQHYRGALQGLVTNERSRCPICGREADFALLNDREHGRRYLLCIHCDLSWPFKRMGCSFCDNRDFDLLSYLIPEHSPGYKIYCCDKCRGYLKTFDQREDVPRLADRHLLEYANTLFLDLLAVNQGYLPR